MMYEPTADKRWPHGGAGPNFRGRLQPIAVTRVKVARAFQPEFGGAGSREGATQAARLVSPWAGERRHALIATPTWAGAVTAWLMALVLWSLTYLARQSLLDASAWGANAALAVTGAADRLAIEGMTLALAWLATLTAGCLAVLSGAVIIRYPDQLEVL